MKLSCLLLICIMLQGCTILISNEYYQYIDKARYIYDGKALLNDEPTTTEIAIDIIKEKT